VKKIVVAIKSSSRNLLFTDNPSPHTDICKTSSEIIINFISHSLLNALIYNQTLGSSYTNNDDNKLNKSPSLDTTISPLSQLIRNLIYSNIIILIFWWIINSSSTYSHLFHIGIILLHSLLSPYSPVTQMCLSKFSIDSLKSMISALINYVLFGKSAVSSPFHSFFPNLQSDTVLSCTLQKNSLFSSSSFPIVFSSSLHSVTPTDLRIDVLYICF
jgi:hypothetical protein